MVLDLGSKCTVGWSWSSRLFTEFVIRAFLIVWMRRRPAQGITAHDPF